MLAPGASIGSYEILSLIGAGGMGEVYRARDTRLGRDVAIKVLPEALATDPERMARFEREARTLASLNHPNIAQVHGLEVAGQVRALAMEFVDGEDLAQRLARGPIPVDEALPMARQIAEALEAAHDRGIVHRDLKPANIKIAADGGVKVLDFGLAKAVQDDASPAHSATGNLPTITSPAHVTRAGIVLGTAAYMAPEQARGRAVDKRADIWAYGVVLYEMLTARRLFDGESVSDTLAAVLTGPLDIGALPPGTPPHVRRLIGRCLTRDPRSRLRDIGEARLALDDTTAEPADAAPVRPARFAPLLLTAVVAAVAGAGAVLVFRPPSSPSLTPSTGVVRASIVLPPDRQMERVGWRMLALSRDGSRMAFTGGGRLQVRDLATGDTRAVEGSDRADSPFFSPDGAWLGFSVGNRLFRVAVGGGSPLPITTAPGPTYGPYWNDDDAIIFSSLGFGVLSVPASGGEPTSVVAPNRATGELGAGWAQPLPGTRSLLYATYLNSVGTADEGQIVIEDLSRPGSRQVLTGGSSAWYLPTGHLLMAHGNRLAAAPFDATARRLTGAAVPVLDDVASYPWNGGVQFAAAANGTIAYVREPTPLLTEFVEISGTGAVRKLGQPFPFNFTALAISPDGKRIAVRAAKANDDIHLFDLERSSISRLTFDGGDEWNPVWSPDGKFLFYASNQAGATNIYRRPADGSGAPERVIESVNDSRPGAVSRDGSLLVYTERNAATGQDLMAVSLTGARTPRPILQTPYEERLPSLSPDGEWLAFESNESGQWQVHTLRLRDGGSRRQVSTNAGTDAQWSADGRELYFLDGENLMASTFASGESSPPRRLFQHRFQRTGEYGRRFDLTPGGRFIVLARSGYEPATEIQLIVNWFEVLKARVPILR